VLAEGGEPVLRIELEGCVAHKARAHFLAEANGLGREIVGDPEADLLDLPEIVGKLRDIIVGQIGLEEKKAGKDAKLISPCTFVKRGFDSGDPDELCRAAPSKQTQIDWFRTAPFESKETPC